MKGTKSELEGRIKELEMNIRYLQNRLKLARQTLCDHPPELIEHIESYGGTKCKACGDRLGWYCENSLTKRCQYDYETHDESCIICGYPEERK